MRALRQYLSLALTILCYGLSNTVWCEPADAEDSATSTLRIIAIYRNDLSGFNLGSFRLTTVLRGSDMTREVKGKYPCWEGSFMRGAARLQARVG